MRFKLIFLLLLTSIMVYAEDIKLLELVEKSQSIVKWNPYRNRGIIYKDDVTISLMLNSNIAVLNNSKIISGINLMQKNNDIYLSKETASYLYRLLKISEDHETIINDAELFSIPVIIIDPGHGGRDPGAVGNHGDFILNEKDVVLDISMEILNRLRRNYSHKKIILTRDTDIFLTLEERVNIANNIILGKKEAVLYISIHANASLNKKARGFEVWYLPKDYRRDVLDTTLPGSQNSIINALKEDELSLEGQELAQSILSGMDSAIGRYSPNRGLKEEIWFVVRNARMASVLLEIGFVTNKIEAENLKDQVYLKSLADGIYNGIVDFVTKYEEDGR